MSMVRIVFVVLMVGGVCWGAAPTPKNDSKPRPESGPEFIRKVLDGKATVAFTQTSLPLALAQLSEDHGLNFVLDKAVVQQMGFEPNDMMIDVKLKDVKLRSGLRTMLNQFNLTVVVVGDTVLVTTEEQAIYKQLMQRVSVSYEDVPLTKAVKELARSHAVNVVIDPRAAKTKAVESSVSLNVDDVPLEAVVRLMCEMAGLKAARIGNVIYVTTEDRADKLKESDGLVPVPSPPGGNALGGQAPGAGAPAFPAVPRPRRAVEELNR